MDINLSFAYFPNKGRKTTNLILSDFTLCMATVTASHHRQLIPRVQISEFHLNIAVWFGSSQRTASRALKPYAKLRVKMHYRSGNIIKNIVLQIMTFLEVQEFRSSQFQC